MRQPENQIAFWYFPQSLACASRKQRCWKTEKKFCLFDCFFLRKDIILASPADFNNLSTFGSQIDLPRRMYRFSQCNVRNTDTESEIERFPRLKRVHLFRAQVEANECLLIPLAWFHDVLSIAKDELCLSVNLFFQATKEELDCYKWLKMFLDDWFFLRVQTSTKHDLFQTEIELQIFQYNVCIFVSEFLPFFVFFFKKKNSSQLLKDLNL